MLEDYALITRIKYKKDILDNALISLIKHSYAAGIKGIFIISPFPSQKITIGDLEINLTYNKYPTSPLSLNSPLKKLKKLKFKGFLVCSREVKIKTPEINFLINTLKRNSNLLVVGYKFRLSNPILNKKLEDNYQKYHSFKIPWNTCALWNYDLFQCLVDQFTGDLGMEDGFAIAKAKKKNPKIKSLLLEQRIHWQLKKSNEKSHQQKISRKETILNHYLKQDK